MSNDHKTYLFSIGFTADEADEVGVLEFLEAEGSKAATAALNRLHATVVVRGLAARMAAASGHAPELHEAALWAEVGTAADPHAAAVRAQRTFDVAEAAAARRGLPIEATLPAPAGEPMYDGWEADWNAMTAEAPHA